MQARRQGSGWLDRVLYNHLGKTDEVGTGGGRTARDGFGARESGLADRSDSQAQGYLGTFEVAACSSTGAQGLSTCFWQLSSSLSYQWETQAQLRGLTHSCWEAWKNSCHHCALSSGTGPEWSLQGAGLKGLLCFIQRVCSWWRCSWSGRLVMAYIHLQGESSWLLSACSAPGCGAAENPASCMQPTPPGCPWEVLGTWGTPWEVLQGFLGCWGCSVSRAAHQRSHTL